MTTISEDEARAAVGAALRAQSVAAIVLPDGAPRETLKSVAALSAASAGFADNPSGFATALVEAWRAVALHGAPSELRPLSGVELDGRVADPAGGRVRSIEIAAICAGFAVASIRDAYASQQDAAAARADLARRAGTAIDIASGLGLDTREWLARLTGEAAMALSRIAANRAPLVRVETGVSLNAIRLAHDLYGDANRAGEIVVRGNIATAAFMPVALEALSR